MNSTQRKRLRDRSQRALYLQEIIESDMLAFADVEPEYMMVSNPDGPEKHVKFVLNPIWPGYLNTL